MSKSSDGSLLTNADEGKNECYFTWVIENFTSCTMFGRNKNLQSPNFFIARPEKEAWFCDFYPNAYNNDDYVSLYLCRKERINGNLVSMGFELQILNSEGVPEISKTYSKTFGEGYCFGFNNYVRKSDLYVLKRKYFLSNDCLTIRVRIWRFNGNLPGTSHWFARTRMHKEAVSFIWSVEEFSSIKSHTTKTVMAPLSSDNSPLIQVDLSLHGGPCSTDNLKIDITVDFKEFTGIVSTICLLNAEGRKTATKKEQICRNKTRDIVTWSVPYFYPTKLLSARGYLENDTLHFYFKFVASKGVVYDAIENLLLGTEGLKNDGRFNKQILCRNDSDEDENFKQDEDTGLLNDLSNDLQSMHLDGLMTDVSLQAGHRSFPAHRNILSARSPVFKVMFAADMREGAEGTVRIEDIDGDTLKRLLDFIYTDSAGDLAVDTATKLYFAADKYQVLRLRRVCADFLVENICVENACDLLLLADAHGDDRFKSFVVSFIEEHRSDVCDTDSWKSLMKNHGTLAAETMLRKFSKC